MVSIILLLPLTSTLRNQKSEIREENSKLIRKMRDKKEGEEKKWKEKGRKGRNNEKKRKRKLKTS